MQTRIAVVTGVVGLSGVLVVAAVNATALRVLLPAISLVAFVWAAVAFINPAWGPLPSRTVGAWVLVAGIGLLVASSTGSCRW